MWNNSLCHNLSFLFLRSKDKKKRGRDEKETQNWRGRKQQFLNAHVAQVTDSHQASSGHCSAVTPPGHCELTLSTRARWQHRSMDPPGKGLPDLQLMLLLHFPGCFMAHSLPGCGPGTVQQLPAEGSGFKWTWDAVVGMSSKGPPGRNALRKEIPGPCSLQHPN